MIHVFLFCVLQSGGLLVFDERYLNLNVEIILITDGGKLQVNVEGL